MMTEEMRDPDAVLARYAEGPAQLEATVADLNETDLDLAQSADTWTIRQIVHHIVDGDDIWSVCIKAALGNSRAVFSLQWYWDLSQVTWAERWNYAGRAVEPSLALFRANRRHVIQLVQGIPDAWERHLTVRWPNDQEQRMTVGDVVEMQAHHTRGHIDDIRKIRGMHRL